MFLKIFSCVIWGLLLLITPSKTEAQTSIDKIVTALSNDKSKTWISAKMRYADPIPDGTYKYEFSKKDWKFRIYERQRGSESWKLVKTMPWRVKNDSETDRNVLLIDGKKAEFKIPNGKTLHLKLQGWKNFEILSVFP